VERTWAAHLVEGQAVVAPFQVRARQLRVHRSRTGSYLTLVLGDRTGDLAAVAWEDAERWHPIAREGAIIFVQGHCQVYNGEVQLLIEHVAPVPPGEVDPADFLPSSSRNPAAMAREFRAELNSVRHRGLRALLELIFDRERFAAFALAPAAQHVHHAYLGGLLEHTLEVARLCRAQVAIHPELDADLLISGALLHDVGKTREYSMLTAFDITDEGGLVGHIPIADALIVQKAAQVPDLPHDLLLQLRHLVLSHHGRHEWQSPQQPKTLEAAALHLADYTSTQLAIFASALRKVERPGNWTPHQRLLDRRLFAAPRAAIAVPPPAMAAQLREAAGEDYLSDDPDAPILELSLPNPYETER
jgi:3'-5' exoribonuclease